MSSRDPQWGTDVWWHDVVVTLFALAALVAAVWVFVAFMHADW